jgi:oligopeptide/dipeptide ABC transporter ATP-binding protein
VSFEVMASETLGVVGESGCGKSTMGKTLLRLHEKSGGQVFYKGQDIFDLSPDELKEMRRYMQMIFQDPFSSLNPRRRIEHIIAQPLKLFKWGGKSVIADKVDSLMEEVGLDPCYKRRYPHQFSGGQRQRVGIARAIALQPEFIVCDESVSALDVSIQAQILNLLCDLQDKYNLTYLFIAHDLSVVEFISNRIMVMYLGKVVELADKETLVENPLHPYTRSLFAASPGIDPRRRDQMEVITGDLPSPISPPEGCHFHPRCPHAMKICRHEYPPAIQVGQSRVCCHLYNDSPDEISP